jgi:hypothetical protein
LEIAAPVGGLYRALSVAAAMLGNEPARAFGRASQDPDVPVAQGCSGPSGHGAVTGSAASTAIGSSGSGSLKSKSRYPIAARADGTDWSA